MKLFLLVRTDYVGWDEYDEVLVRAKSEDDAREIANKKLDASFANGKTSTCKEVKVSGDEGIIISSFQAG